ncbi:MAG: extracellular solute-binding protein [bacterium]|nr:extracellular solute-binding protein [bacterium]
MGEKRSIFQVVILGAFAFFIIAAVFIFAGLTGGGENTNVGPVVIWGTFDQSLMDSYLGTLGDEDERVKNVIYEEHSPRTFQSELVEALAGGRGPDLFFMEQAHLLRHWDKIEPYSYDLMSERSFKDTFVDESELFLSESGINALPFALDPLVMYWNRDIFAEAGFAKPPQYWDELFIMSERITKRDRANNIERATVAFGEFDNVNNAKDIISTLIMQVGGAIVVRTGGGGAVREALAAGASDTGVAPAQSALRFYTEFANPVKTIYSWNRSLPQAQDAFAQGKLALYMGYASELAGIQAKNAHLNFDVALLPQIRAGESKRVLTFGTLHALAVPFASQNKRGAVEMARFLTGPVASQLFNELYGTMSPRRDLLSDTPSDSLKLVFRDAALISRAWPDPQAEETERIFRRMVSDITSGTLRISDSVERANQELRTLINSQ